MIEPFVALMRRYVVDYTCSHDLSVCDEIMDPSYVVRIAGMTLERDTAYKPGVAMVFERFPGLCLAIHEIVTNGDRLAMRFSEHGADLEAEGKTCAWRAIALYRWNGSKLLECRVEQDFLSRERQLATGAPDPLEPPHLDPWTTTAAEPASPEADRAARAWLEAGDLGAAASGSVDDADVAAFAPLVAVDAVETHDLFSAGDRVAFHATLRGEYVGDFPDTGDRKGAGTQVDAAGLLTVRDGAVADARIVTDRIGLLARLTGRPIF